jgi:predicted GIY-YIG superfamily endonuclease
MAATDGTVYLLHYAEPLGRLQHYVGWTSDLDQRLRQHASGDGSTITARFHQAGTPFVLARTWPGTRQLERKIKQGGPANYCPLCRDRRGTQRAAARGQAELKALLPTPESGPAYPSHPHADPIAVAPIIKG